MEILMGWIHKVDFTAVIASVVTFVAGLAVIKPRLTKALELIGDLSVVLADIKKAGEDGKFSTEEIKQIASDGEHLISEFKK